MCIDTGFRGCQLGTLGEIFLEAKFKTDSTENINLFKVDKISYLYPQKMSLICVK